MGGDCSQSGCEKAAFVLGLVSNVDGFDEMHIQHSPLQEPDGFRILGVDLEAGLTPWHLGVVDCSLQLLTAKGVVCQLQHHMYAFRPWLCFSL